MDSIEKRLIRLNGTQAEDYASLVEAQIRKRYSVSAERRNYLQQLPQTNIHQTAQKRGKFQTPL